MMLLAGRDRQCVLTNYVESRETTSDLDTADPQVSKKTIQLRYLSHV